MRTATLERTVWDHNRNPPRKEIPQYKKGDRVSFIVSGHGDIATGTILAIIPPNESLYKLSGMFQRSDWGRGDRGFRPAEFSKRWTRCLVRCDDGVCRTPNVFALHPISQPSICAEPRAALSRGLGRKLASWDSSQNTERVGAFVDMTDFVDFGGRKIK